jgi:hypothetical protein
MQARLYVVFRNAASSLEDEAPQSDRERGLVASPYDETVKKLCSRAYLCLFAKNALLLYIPPE